MKFLLISPKNRTVYNFRGDLVKELIRLGYEVIVTGPDGTDAERIIELGVRFIEIPMNKNGTSIIGDLRYCFQLFSFMKSNYSEPPVPGITNRPSPDRREPIGWHGRDSLPVSLPSLYKT